MTAQKSKTQFYEVEHMRRNAFGHRLHHNYSCRKSLNQSMNFLGTFQKTFISIMSLSYFKFLHMQNK